MSLTDQAKRNVQEFSSAGEGETRLYKNIVRALLDDLHAGVYAVGDKMPAERDLALRMGVSRPVVREAMLALEVLGLIEVRLGAGTFVIRLPGESDAPEFSVSPFELLEARLLFEGEAAALAASHITDEEVAQLETLVEEIQRENRQSDGKEDADLQFHLVIARASRNAAVERTILDLWTLRSTSPECKLLQEKARIANVRPVVEEHNAIVEALRQRDPTAARAAMRAHLDAVLQHLLFAVEEDAVAEARRSVAKTRERFQRKTGF
ncbi:FadR/GntR family transcriptional regulator [Novosphingobium sp. M1R2S20]|uniref:FadR/GntR family transcriptional regulator n=1 Tax=Novosphingobium rhizovicinum TaxID=3228928 RepID=A0ABV3RE63_9SPHN